MAPCMAAYKWGFVRFNASGSSDQQTNNATTALATTSSATKQMAIATRPPIKAHRPHSGCGQTVFARMPAAPAPTSPVINDAKNNTGPIMSSLISALTPLDLSSSHVSLAASQYDFP